MRLALVLALALLPGLSFAQSTTTSSNSEPPRLTPSPTNPRSSSTNTTALQASVDRLTQTNNELLDLLKKQQTVLEDIQYDRRLQSHQIESLEERLQETLIENTQLQNKIDKLSNAATAPQSGAIAGTSTNQSPSSPATPPGPPPRPASYLPPAPSETMPGAPSWHRLFALSGTDSRSTDLFHVQGRQWRVVWHNQDPDGKAYKDTSALFLNAFPKDDTVPQKVCSKLGSGGDSTQLVGPGNYYIKIEAAGGSWELAVEDFH